MLLRLLFVALALATASLADSQGTFELRLKSFSNPLGTDLSGRCCAGYRSSGSAGTCTGQCRTRFRVCLKHYQATIDPSDECTFGEAVTPAENNAANLEVVRFPLDFKWPGTFSLIIEAWHDKNQSSSSAISGSGVLISRLATQQELSAGRDWTRGVHQDRRTRLEYDYRMACSAHYYGADCDTLCRPRDDQFGHYTCGPQGEKVCLDGWQKDPTKPEGDYCTKAKCLEGCHSEHGECERPGQCKCKTGYTGPLCDRCILYPGCVHGTCDKPYQCLCQEGWGGLFCNEDLNYCTNHRPCRNGATCRNTGQGLYTCDCPPGYAGRNCEERISNECQEHQPCVNGGTCQGSGSDYKCVCPLGFHGRHCERSAQTCQDAPCRNGATCRDVTGGGYQCQCRPEFHGVNCDLEVDHCRAMPCQNGGTCSLTPGGDSFQCRCPAGFAGDRCEVNIDDCALNPCQNGGTCFDFVNDYQCYCHAGFVGRHCEVNVDECRGNPCANGGTCHDAVNGFECTCPPGFTGKDCSQEVNECAASPCMHGFCIDKLNAFECKCLPGYSGTHCNVLPDGTVLEFVGAKAGASAPSAPSQVALVATFSVLVPACVLLACLLLCCSKRRRKRDQRRQDLAAERENELNAVHSHSAAKMIIEDHRIVNALDFPNKRVNANPNLAPSSSSPDASPSSKMLMMGGKAGNKAINTSASALCDKLENSSVVSCGSSSEASGAGPRYCNLVPTPSGSGYAASTVSSVASSASSASSHSQPPQHYQHRSKDYGLPTAASINAAAAASAYSSPKKTKTAPADLFATEV